MAKAQARARKAAPANPTKFVREADKTREDLLLEIAGLPSAAFIRPRCAAAYLGTTTAVLATWRSIRRGPRYHGANEFVRYRISDLASWMATRAGEVVPDSDTLSHRDEAAATTT